MSAGDRMGGPGGPRGGVRGWRPGREGSLSAGVGLLTWGLNEGLIPPGSGSRCGQTAFRAPGQQPSSLSQPPVAPGFACPHKLLSLTRTLSLGTSLVGSPLQGYRERRFDL